MITNRQLSRIKSKIESILLGTGTDCKGLGVTLTINKYTFTLNNYGEYTKTLSATTNIQAVLINSVDYDSAQNDSINYADGELRFYISSDLTVEDTATYHYEFVYSGTTYVLVYSRKLGQFKSVTGLVQEISVKPIN